MRLYNKDKWLDIINDTKYQKIRDKIQETFKDIVFYEDEHRYFVGDRELTCVSNVTHAFQEHFDTNTVAEATYNRHFNNPDSKYYQMTVDEIKAEWKRISDTACETGTDRHNFGESCLHFMMGDYDGIVSDFKDRLHKDENGDYYMESIYPKEDAVVRFWNDIPKSIVPILAENKVYVINDEYAYSGTFDILFYYDAEIDGKDRNKSGLLIFDYKTNVDLYKNYNSKKLLYPFNELLDMPLNIYKLQLSLYQLALEKIDLKVIGRRLIWLKPNGTYDKIPLETYYTTLDETLKKIRII